MRIRTRGGAADFNKLILATNRTTLDNAAAYVRYLLKAVSEEELFAFLAIDVTGFWERCVKRSIPSSALARQR